MRIKTIQTSNKNFILDVGWKKNRNKNWDGGYLYYPFLHSTVYCVLATHNYNISQWWNAGMGNTDTLHPNSCFCFFPSLHFRIKFLLLVYTKLGLHGYFFQDSTDAYVRQVCSWYIDSYTCSHVCMLTSWCCGLPSPLFPLVLV